MLVTTVDLIDLRFVMIRLLGSFLCISENFSFKQLFVTDVN
jgi:hypothetical protein